MFLCEHIPLVQMWPRMFCVAFRYRAGSLKWERFRTEKDAFDTQKITPKNVFSNSILI